MHTTTAVVFPLKLSISVSAMNQWIRRSKEVAISPELALVSLHLEYYAQFGAYQDKTLEY